MYDVPGRHGQRRTGSAYPGVLPKVAVVILNWNGLADTGECLQSANRQEYPDLEVLVIDNGSAPEPDQVVSRQVV